MRKSLLGFVGIYLFQPIQIAKEIYKGKIYFQREYYDDAIVCFELVVSKQKNHSKYLYYLALSYYLNRDFIKSAQVFQKISKKSEYYLISKVYLNQALMKISDIGSDYAQYKDIHENLEFIANIKDEKLNFRELMAKGAACAALKKYKSAEEAYSKAINLIENSLKYKHKLFRFFCPDIYENLSHAYCLLGVTSFNFATEESKKNGLDFLYKSNSIDSNFLPALRYIGISFAKKVSPDIKLVSKYFEKALSINQVSYETRKQYGKAYEYLGDAEAKDSEKAIFYYNLSLNQYEIAIKLKENYPELLKEYAGVLCKVRKYVRACQFLERAVQLNSIYFIAYYDLAKARLDFSNYAHDQHLLDDFEIIEILLKSLDSLKELNNLESYYKKQDQIDSLREKIYRKIISFVMQLISKMSGYKAVEICSYILQFIDIGDNQVTFSDLYFRIVYEKGKALISCKDYTHALKEFNFVLSKKPNDFYALNLKGECLLKLEDFPEAEKILNRAIESNREYFSKTKTGYKNFWFPYEKLGQLYKRQSKYSQAIQVLSDCLELNYHPKTYIIEIQIGEIYYAKGLQEKSVYLVYEPRAHNSFQKAISYFEKIENFLSGKVNSLFTNQYSLNKSNIEKIKNYPRVLKNLCDIYWFLDHKNSVQNSNERFWDKAGEISRLGTDWIRRLEKLSLPINLISELRQNYSCFEQLTVDSYVRAYLISKTQASLIQALLTAEEGKNACAAWLTGELLSKKQIEWSNFKQIVSPNVAIIYWHLSPNSINTFIVKYGEDYPILVNKNLSDIQLNDLTIWIRTWKFQYRDYLKSLISEGKNLSQTLSDNVDSILPILKKRIPKNIKVRLLKLANILKIGEIFLHLDNVKHIVLIPHRDLHLLPLHALFEQDPSYRNRFSYSYLPSAAMGLKNNYISESLPFVSIESPKINNIDEARLYLSEFEVQRIEKIFKDKNLTTKLIKRTEASKNVILDVLKQGYNVFHFAGHAQHNFKKPKKSKLYLANGDELTFEDICHLHISSRQKNVSHHGLVCLSACETAIASPVSITTEYIGMSSAFLKAGAALVVSTLWPVREIATSLFMMEFYHLAFSEGKSVITALRDAQSWLRNSTREEFVKRYNRERLCVGGELKIPLMEATNQLKAEGDPSDRPFSSPYYWAAFIITGLPYDL